jgi:hypothetical protein
MSALGQKQTFRGAIGMSALPPKADMCSATRHVRFVPIADMKALQERLSDEGRSARQDNPDLSELTGLRIDLDGARVLFHDDIVTD